MMCFDIGRLVDALVDNELGAAEAAEARGHLA